jgi:hypothetical protein
MYSKVLSIEKLTMNAIALYSFQCVSKPNDGVYVKVDMDQVVSTSQLNF